MTITKETTANLVKKFGSSEKDTGNPAVQVAILTERINSLTAHLKANKKDAASQRGLMKLVGQRRSLLRYLQNNDYEAYLKLIADLGLRK